MELALIIIASIIAGFLLCARLIARRTGQTMLDVLRGKPGEERAEIQRGKPGEE